MPFNPILIRPITEKSPFRVLFVCLGNICRSPTAEGTFIHEVKRAGLERFFIIDSAGLGPWHVGEPPHRITMRVAEMNGVHLPSIGRMLMKQDLENFDLILAMDRENYAGIVAKTLDPDLRKKVCLYRDFDPEAPGSDVPDPYYGELSDFEEVFRICQRTSKALLDTLRKAIVAEPLVS
jgi:protein-tyrosine phosphatase